MSNLDPTHAIPLLAAGALQSGMAFCIMPTASGGFAVLLTTPEPMSDAEIEANSISAIADVDMMDLPMLLLARQLCAATNKLAEFIAASHPEHAATLAGMSGGYELSTERATELRAADFTPDWMHLDCPGPFVKPTQPATPGVVTYTQETGAND